MLVNKRRGLNSCCRRRSRGLCRRQGRCIDFARSRIVWPKTWTLFRASHLS